MVGIAGSIRQRGKQSWEVRAFAGKDPATGKKQYVTKTVRGERREAEIALGRLLGEIDDGQHAVRAGTVGDLCERWFAHAAPDLSPSVVPEHRRLLDNRILPRWGTTPLRRLRTADLDLWYAELGRSGGLKGGGPLAPNSVTRIHAVLRRALAQGVKWGWITINPAAKASPPRARKQQARVTRPGRRRPPHRSIGEREPVTAHLLSDRCGNRRSPRRDVRPAVEARRLQAASPHDLSWHRRSRRPARREGHQDAPGADGDARRGHDRDPPGAP